MLIEILDGGMGYELNKYYSDFGKDALENNNDLITHIYNEFVKAGCGYITTCNYTCRPSLDDNWENNTKIAIKIAQSVKASNTNICICGSLPPYNKSYANYEIDDNFKVFYNKIIKLMQNKVDYFLIETCYSLDHAVEIIKIVNSIVEYPKILLSVYPTKENGINIAKMCALNIKGLFINCCSFDKVVCFHRDYIKKVGGFKNKIFGFYCNKINEEKYANNSQLHTLQSLKERRNISKELLHDFLGQIDNSHVFIGGCCGYGINDMKELVNTINTVKYELKCE